MSVRLPRALSVQIAGPAGPLEALLEEPEPLSANAFAVVCHPHPLHGGTMQNKVVHTIARACQVEGMPTVRFNFRGVGASAGSYDEGRGELQDTLAAIAWVGTIRSQPKPSPRSQWKHTARALDLRTVVQ